MANINSACVSGNLTRDAVQRGNGQTVAVAFTVAVNDRRMNRDSGEWEDVPSFIDCVAFGKYGESIAQYLTKGAAVSVHGKLKQDSYEKDGQRRSRVQIVADAVQLPPRQQRPAQDDDDLPW